MTIKQHRRIDILVFQKRLQKQFPVSGVVLEPLQETRATFNKTKNLKSTQTAHSPSSSWQQRDWTIELTI